MTLVVMTAALVCASALPVFADWETFQMGGSNNAYFALAGNQAAPLTQEVEAEDKVLTSPAAIELPTEGEDVFVGVDAGTVTAGEIAYTLYNGGVVGNEKGGARMRATNLNTGAKFWDVQIFPADNVEQLATPVIDGSTIYAAVDENTSIFSSDSITKGEIANGATEPVVITEDLELLSDMSGIQVSTNLKGTTEGSITGQIVLTNTENPENPENTYELGDNSYYDGNMIFYNLNGDVVPEGTYKLELQITNKTGGTLNLTSANVTIPTWDLVKVEGINTDLPSVTYLTDGPQIYKEGAEAGEKTIYQGYGEPATPLKIYDGKLYFGIYDGDRCYYQYDLTRGAFDNISAVRFAPGDNNDFYWAGAAQIESGGQSYIVFGSNAGVLYVQPVNDFSGTGKMVDLTDYNDVPGSVRSSIVVGSGTNEGYIFFTSQGCYLWSAAISSLFDGTAAEGTGNVKYIKLYQDDTAESVSTPAVLPDGRIYVGYNYNYATLGGLWIGKAEGTTITAAESTISMEAPVDSSPLVYYGYDINGTDYVYFTTNSETGGGYCYSVESDGTYEELWNIGVSTDPTNNASYTLQGMSVGANGTLVFGNDLDQLFVIPNTPAAAAPPAESETSSEAEEAPQTEAAAE